MCVFCGGYQFLFARTLVGDIERARFIGPHMTVSPACPAYNGFDGIRRALFSLWSLGAFLWTLRSGRLHRTKTAFVCHKLATWLRA